MQLELTLKVPEDAEYDAGDLGYLLHKNPARVFSRNVSAGTATVFYSEVTDSRCTAVLHLDVDPVAPVRGKNKQIPDCRRKPEFAPFPVMGGNLL